MVTTSLAGNALDVVVYMWGPLVTTWARTGGRHRCGKVVVSAESYVMLLTSEVAFGKEKLAEEADGKKALWA